MSSFAWVINTLTIFPHRFYITLFITLLLCKMHLNSSVKENSINNFHQIYEVKCHVSLISRQFNLYNSCYLGYYARISYRFQMVIYIAQRLSSIWIIWKRSNSRNLIERLVVSWPPQLQIHYLVNQMHYFTSHLFQLWQKLVINYR